MILFAVDKYHCPVTYKVFTPNSHIVAIKPTGNVFAYEVRKTQFTWVTLMKYSE